MVCWFGTVAVVGSTLPKHTHIQKFTAQKACRHGPHATPSTSEGPLSYDQQTLVSSA